MQKFSVLKSREESREESIVMKSIWLLVVLGLLMVQVISPTPVDAADDSDDDSDDHTNSTAAGGSSGGTAGGASLDLDPDSAEGEQEDEDDGDNGSGGGTIFKLGGLMIIHGEVRSKLSELTVHLPT